MFRKLLLGAAVASQAFAFAAYAAPARPQAVSFDSVKRVQSTQVSPRASTSAGRENDLAGTPILLPLLGVGALVAVVAIVASGGDDDSSPN